MTTPLDDTRPLRRLGATFLRAALVCGLVLACQARAQNALFVQPSELLPGIKAHELLDSGSHDQPGIFNGDSHITVLATPTITLSGAAEIAIRAGYSHKFYHAYERVCPGASGACGEVYAHRVHASGTPEIGLGWTLSAVPFVVVQDPQHDDITFTTYHSFDGGQHKLGETDLAYSKDGSDLRAVRLYDGGLNLTGFVITEPDGTELTLTHKFYRAPSANGSDVDRDHDLQAESRVKRFALTSMKDRFGQVVIPSVTYGSNDPASPEAWKVLSIALSGNRTITFNWGTHTNSYAAGWTQPFVTWPVLNSITFPTVSGQTLQTTFTFRSDGFYPRGYLEYPPYFECSGTAGLNPAPDIADFPMLSSITTGDRTYTFEYSLGKDDVNAMGGLTALTLPTGGRIQYELSKKTSGGLPCIHNSGNTNCPNPEVATAAPAEATADPPSPTDFSICDKAAALKRYLDYSPSVTARIETDPITGLVSRTDYVRREFAENADPFGNREIDPERMLRHVLVKKPDGNGNVLTTLHLFLLAPGGEESSGTELERRSYAAGATGNATPLRTTVNCFDVYSVVGGVYTHHTECGVLDSAGKIHEYGGIDYLYHQKELTWYGANPSGAGKPSGQRDCADPDGAGRACRQVTNEEFNPYAREFRKTTVSIPGTWPSTAMAETDWRSRTTMTEWIQNAALTEWLPKRYSSRTMTDGFANGTCPPPTPCLQTTTTNYTYHGTLKAFVTSMSTSDPVQGTVTRTRSPDAFGNPITETAQSSGPGFDGVAFNTNRTFDKGLLTTSSRSGLVPSWRSFDATRDANTGLITQSRDPNSWQTNYTYDTQRRLTVIAPPNGEEPTTVGYRLWTPASPGQGSYVVVKKGPTGSANPLETSVSTPTEGSGTASLYLYDGSGRLIREAQLLPNLPPNPPPLALNFTVRETRYNAAGLRSFQSEWIPCLASGYPAGDMRNCFTTSLLGAPGTTFSNFDFQGRPRTITGPDGAVTKKLYDDVLANIPASDTFEQTTILNVSGQNVTNAFRKNPFGKIIVIADFEPDPNAVAAGVTGIGFNLFSRITDYHWNILDKPAAVVQTRPEGTQQRLFGYDQTGHLRSESHPEKGLTSYTKYDALDNVRTKTEGGTSYENVYDPAGRLTELKTTGVGGATYLRNWYDGTMGPNVLSLSLGKLTRQIGYNPEGFENAEITDDFAYAPNAGGRLTFRSTTIKHPDGTVAFTATQSFGHNPMGLLSLHQHANSSGPPLTESTFYKAGLPTRINADGVDVLADATYNTAGGIATYRTANNVTTTIAQPANRMARPLSISTSGASQNFSTGDYSYDGAGNVTAIGADQYTYDASSRLIDAKPAGAATPRDQFDYDNFNNLKTHIVDGATYLFPAFPSNNRLQNALYDLQGNMTSYGNDVYTYDKISRQTSYVGSGVAEEYLFDGAGERIVRRGAPSVTLQILTTTLPNGALGTLYNGSGSGFQIAASGGISPYVWSVAAGSTLPNGLTLSTDGRLLGFPGKSGIFKFTLQAQDNAGVAQTATKTFLLSIHGPTRFYTITPCRVINTTAGADGGILLGQSVRTFSLSNKCGIPSTAKAVAANVVAVTPTIAGEIRVYPAGLDPPNISTVMFRNGITRASAAILGIHGPTPGSVSVFTALPAGHATHFILDVSGYFEPTTPGSLPPEPTAEAEAPESPAATTGVWYYTLRNGNMKPSSEFENGIKSKDYIYLGSNLIATYEKNRAVPAWTYYSSDHLGTPRLVTNSLGQTLAQYKYRPFGLSLGTSPGIGFGFAGMEKDHPASNAVNFYDHARSVSSWTGRFNGVDAVGGREDDPHSWNRYSYAANNPVLFFDPSGDVKFRSTADQAAYAQASAYLAESPTGHSTMRSLNALAGDQEPTLVVSDDVDNLYDPQRNVIYWNPNLSLDVTGAGGSPGADGGWVRSAAVGLLHEAAHALGRNADRKAFDARVANTKGQGRYGNAEEKRVIVGPETKAARELGEATRKAHEGKTIRAPQPETPPKARTPTRVPTCPPGVVPCPTKS